MTAEITPRILRRLEAFTVQARRTFMGQRQGGHLSLKRGTGIEFSEYRQYELGDNPRHIDWGVYGRTDRLYIKRFQEEEDLSVLIFIDNSASMTHSLGSEKWRFSRLFALAMSFIALTNQDTVRIVTPGLIPSPALSGPRAIYDAIRYINRVNLDDPKTISGENMIKTAHHAASVVRFPGIGIFLSDFLMPLERIVPLFDILGARNLELHAIQILGEQDLDPIPNRSNATIVDSESGEELSIGLSAEARTHYGSLLTEHNKQIETFFASRQNSYTVAVVPDAPSESPEMESCLFDTLTRSGIVR